MELQSIKRRFGIVGNSEKLDRALSSAARVANTDLTVLIQGDSGVGKEVFSKIIHSLSSRKHNEFIAVNCAAIPAGTINSELFGHEKGSFTGATSDRKGYFETVNGGTIFLDEVGEMPLDTQSYLLRVLENGEFIRVGSSKVLNTDIRVIAATNVDLREKIKEKKFREDLYYRLNTVPIFIPSLRERTEDILLLFKKFARDFADKYNSPTIEPDDDAMILIRNYGWPGNIRELKNVVEKLSILSDERLISVDKLLEIVPDIAKRNLPVSLGNPSVEDIKDRELVYKFLFDMKRDLSELKSLFYDLVNINDLSLPSVSVKDYDYENDRLISENRLKNTDIFPDEYEIEIKKEDKSDSGLNRGRDEQKYEIEILDENLNIFEMEKTLIIKALKKHNGKRKNAADELGLSERTLYRKIKEYDINI
ncbi:MAG: sigma-54-dependent Fis family transcriptional regulator [Saprospiraceae bacterium]|nr:sigma-54-dependent Fis family transcriptional regulator [Saprospiraceae bacterium]